MNEKVKLIKVKKGDKASIRVRWTDNGQIMMELVCDPDGIDALEKLFDFVAEMTDTKEDEEP